MSRYVRRLRWVFFGKSYCAVGVSVGNKRMGVLGCGDCLSGEVLFVGA